MSNKLPKPPKSLARMKADRAANQAASQATEVRYQPDEHDVTNPHTHDKGGLCNREACQSPGAYWYNHSTRRYYCDACAHRLNTDEFNMRDAARLYGHDLCTYRGPNKLSLGVIT